MSVFEGSDDHFREPRVEWKEQALSAQTQLFPIESRLCSFL